MANNEGFIDILSPSALKDLKEANSEVLVLIGNINKAKAVQLAKTPSQSNDAIKQLNADLVAQEKLIRSLQSKLTSLASTQKTANANDREAIVNRRIQNRQTDQAIIANSELAGAYANLSAKEAIAARNLQNLIASGKASNSQLKTAQRELDTYRKRLLLADEATGRWGRTNFRTINTVRDLMGAFGIVGGITLFAMMSKDIFDTTRELQSLDLALTQVTGSHQAAAEAQAFLTDIAERYGLEIKNLTRAYTQFYVSAKDKLSGDEIKGIFDSIGKAAGTMGLSVEQQDRAFLALTQMLSKGTVNAEELRGQLGEALPGAFGILAKSMNVSERQLGKMLEQGQVLAADVLPAFAKQLEKAYGIENITRVESLNASTTRLSNTWTEFVKNLNEGNGAFSRFLSTAIDGLGFLINAVGNLLTSKEQDRANLMKKIRDKHYNETLEYFKSLAEIDTEVVKNLKTQNVGYIAELQAQIDKLKERNKELNGGGGWGSGRSNARERAENEAQIKNLIAQQSGYNGEIMAYNALLTEQAPKLKKVVELTKAQLEALEKLRQERLKNKFDREISDLERRRKLAEDLFDEENQYADARIKRSEQIFNIEYTIEQRKFVEQLRLHNNSLDLQAIDANNFRTATEEAEKRNQDRITQIHNDAVDERREYVEQYAGEGIKLNLPSTDDYTDKVEEDLKNLTEALRDLRQEMGDTFTSFQSELFDGAGFSNLFKILNNEIAGFGKSFKKEFDKIEQLKAMGHLTDDEYAAKYKEINDAKRESAFNTGLAISEAFQEAANFVNNIQQQQYEAQYARLEKEKEVALAFAGESAEARVEIERQSEERRKQIARQQAESQKRAAIFNIAINTAQALVAQLAATPLPFGTGFLALIAAIGAAQIIAVNSQAIPQFKDGGKHKGGLMMINDQPGSSYREIIKTPDGKVSMPEGRNVIMNAPAGTEIFSAAKSRQMLDNILMNNGVGYSKPQQGGISDRGVDRIVNALQSMPQGESITWNIDARGERILRNNQNRQQELMNNKKSFTAKRIGR